MAQRLIKLNDGQLAAILAEHLGIDLSQVEVVIEKCGKVCYGHESTALEAAVAMNKKTGDSYDAYECAFCEAWHIGHSR